MQESALAVAVSRAQKWDAVAAAIHERGLLASCCASLRMTMMASSMLTTIR
jgi:hypothetical protein